MIKEVLSKKFLQNKYEVSIRTLKEDLIKSSHIKDEAAEICSTSKVSLDRVSPVVFLSKYDFGNLRRLVNMSTLILITTLLEIQELVLTEIKEKIELRVIIENNMIALSYRVSYTATSYIDYSDISILSFDNAVMISSSEGSPNFSDILFDGPNVNEDFIHVGWIDYETGNPDVLYGTSEIGAENLMNIQTMNQNIEDGYIIEIGQKVNSYEKICGQYIGLMKFQGSGIDLIKKYYENHKSEIIKKSNYKKQGEKQ